MKCLYAEIPVTPVLASLRDLVTMACKQMPGRDSKQKPEAIKYSHTAFLCCTPPVCPCTSRVRGCQTPGNLLQNNSAISGLDIVLCLSLIQYSSSCARLLKNLPCLPVICHMNLCFPSVSRFQSLFPELIFQAIKIKWAVFSKIFNSEQNQKVGQTLYLSYIEGL